MALTVGLITRSPYEDLDNKDDWDLALAEGFGAVEIDCDSLVPDLLAETRTQGLNIILDEAINWNTLSSNRQGR